VSHEPSPSDKWLIDRGWTLEAVNQWRHPKTNHVYTKNTALTLEKTIQDMEVSKKRHRGRNERPPN